MKSTIKNDFSDSSLLIFEKYFCKLILFIVKTFTNVPDQETIPSFDVFRQNFMLIACLVTIVHLNLFRKSVTFRKKLFYEIRGLKKLVQGLFIRELKDECHDKRNFPTKDSTIFWIMMSEKKYFEDNVIQRFHLFSLFCTRWNSFLLFLVAWEGSNQQLFFTHECQFLKWRKTRRKSPVLPVCVDDFRFL